jgi:hypothetical protein
MSHLSKVFNKVPVRVQDKSGFDMSHENLFSATVGTLIPASVEEVMPGDVVSVGSAMSVELPPLATNFKGRVDARLEAFFVPNRLLWAGWKDFIVQDPNHKPVVPGFSVPTNTPTVRLTASTAGAGSLADYLGVKTFAVSGNVNTVDVNALPFLAYHKIWDDWYRDSNIQQPFFVDGIDASDAAGYGASRSPYVRVSGNMNLTGTSGTGSVVGYNGRDLRSLAQRNFAKDYFTTMTTEPQSGAAASLEFKVDSAVDPDTGTQSGSFTIASLRAANSLQKWLERNNLGGTRYYDQILAHYGVLPSDAAMQRALLLGSMTTPVIVNSISQQAQGTNAQTKNPYGNSTGAQFGRGNAFGKDSLIDNFKVTEHGFIFILFSLVPHAYYSTGSRRYITHRNVSSDYAFPEFANIGDQPVYKDEMVSDSNLIGTPSGVGYAQRYAEYKYHDDEVHGLLRDGANLNAFVLSRGFDGSASLNSSLLEIPTNYMDSVMVTTAGVSGFNAIVDCYFDAKYLRVLPEYSLPSLSSGEDGYDHHTVDVPKGGTRL